MNEEKSVMNAEKPRKKRHSLWWLWFLLILAAFAGGAVFGLKLNTLPLPMEVKDRLYPVLESYIPGSTTPHTPEAAITPAPAPTPVPTAVPEPAAQPEVTVTPAETAPVPTETPALEEEPAMQPETPAVTEVSNDDVLTVSETAVFQSSAEPVRKYIGVGAALEAALDHAQIAETDAEISGVYRTKDDDGETVYEVSFQSGDYTYDYVVDALSGEIVGWKMSGFQFSDTAAYAASFTGDAIPEAEVSPSPVPTDASVSEPEMIGEENAREIAFKHAAVKETDVLLATMDLQGEQDAEVYKLEFKTATRSFSYEIDAYSGEILGYEQNKL